MELTAEEQARLDELEAVYGGMDDAELDELEAIYGGMEGAETYSEPPELLRQQDPEPMQADVEPMLDSDPMEQSLPEGGSLTPEEEARLAELEAVYGNLTPEEMARLEELEAVYGDTSTHESAEPNMGAWDMPTIEQVKRRDKESDPKEVLDTILSENDAAMGKGFKLGMSALFDLPNTVIEALSGGKSAEYGIHGRAAEDYIGSLMTSAGIEHEPEPTLKNAIITEATSGMSAVGIFGVLGKIGTGSQSMRIFTETSEQLPAAIRAALGLSVPSGVGRKYGGDFAESKGIDRRTGEEIGSLAGGASLWGIQKGTDLARKGVSRLGETVGWTVPAQTRVAKQMLMKSTANENTLAKIESTDFNALPGKPNLGQATNDAGLMSAHESIIGQKSAVSAKGRAASKAESQRSALIDELDVLRPNSDESLGIGQKWFRDKTNGIINKLQEKMFRKQVLAQKKIDELQAKAPEDVIPEDFYQVVFQRTGRTVLNDIDDAEIEVWRMVGDGTFKVDDTAKLLSDAYEKVQKISTNPDKVLRRVMRRFSLAAAQNRAMDIDEIKGMRTELNERIHLLETKNKGRGTQQSREMKKVRDAMLDTISPASGDVDMMAYADARKFTRNLYKTIREGAVGKVLGQKEGEFVVTPEKAIATLNLKDHDGIRAFEKMKEGIRMLHPDPKKAEQAIENLDGLVQDYLKVLFSLQDTDAKRKTFLSANSGYKNILNKFPELRDKMSDAAEAIKISDSVSKSAQARIARVKKFQDASKFIGSSIQKDVLNTFADASPAGAARRLVQRAKEDQTGETLDAVKSVFFDAIYDRSTTTTADGVTSINPEKMRGLLKYYKPTIKEVYGDSGVKVLDRVLKGAEINKRTSRGATIAGDIETKELQGQLKTAMGNAAVLLGAKLHKLMGITANSLLFAGMARNASNTFASHLFDGELAMSKAIFERALLDPMFAKELLKTPSFAPISKINPEIRKMLLAKSFIGADEAGSLPQDAEKFIQD